MSVMLADLFNFIPAGKLSFPGSVLFALPLFGLSGKFGLPEFKDDVRPKGMSKALL
jgi:hypothetical protein